MFCKHCGGSLKEGKKFCNHCGKPQNAVGPDATEQHTRLLSDIVHPPVQQPHENSQAYPPVYTAHDTSQSHTTTRLTYENIQPYAVPNTKPRKKNKGALIAAALLLILLVGLGVGGLVVWRMMPEAEAPRDDNWAYRRNLDDEVPINDTNGVAEDEHNAEANDPETAQETETNEAYADEPEPEPEGPTPSPGYMHSMLEDLLVEYRTLFMSWEEQSNYLYGPGVSWYDGDMQAPLSPAMQAAPYLRTFDNLPGLDVNPNAIVGGLLSAQSFIIVDIDDNGVPAVLISYLLMFANGPWVPHVMYVYTGGQYSPVGALLSPEFYVCEDGRLIVIEWSWDAVASYITLVDGSINLEFVAEWEAWSGEDGFVFDHDNPMLPGGHGGSLTPIHRQADIANSLRDVLTPRVMGNIVGLPPVFAQATPQSEFSEWELYYYVLPFSHLRLVTYEDLAGFTAAELRIARNEIFARHGRRFVDEGLQAHFNNMPWYTPTLPLGEEPEISDLELANAEFIHQVELGR